MIENTRERIVRGVTYFTVSKIFLKVSSVAGFFIIVTNLSLKDYGLLNLLFSILGPAAVFSMLGLEHLVTADVAYSRGKKLISYGRKLLLDYLSLSSALLFILCTAAWFLRHFLDRFYEADLTYYFWSLVFLIIGQLGMNFTSIVFESHERFGLSAWLQFGESGFRLVFLAALFFIGFSLPSVLWAYILSKIAITFVMLPFMLATLRVPKYEPDSQNLIFDVMRSHGKWETVKTMINVSTDNLGPWFINFFVSTEAVALYAFAQKVYSTVTTAIPLKKILFPVISNSIGKSQDVARIIITKAQKILFYGYIPIALGLIFLSGSVVTFFFPGYHEATILLQLMSIHLILEVYTTGQSDILYALKQQRSMFTLSMVVIAIRVLTQVVFLAWFGVVGMVVSWLVTTLASAYMKEYLLRKIDFSVWNWRAFFTFDDYDKIILRMISQKVQKLIPSRWLKI